MKTIIVDHSMIRAAAGVISGPSAHPQGPAVDLARPPTLFGRQSPSSVAEDGHRLARQAIGYQLENVPLKEAVDELLAQVPQRDALQMAHDYLAYTPFEAPLSTQVDALFLVEDALNRFDLPDPHQTAAGAISRLGERVGAWLNRRQKAVGQSAA
jgi:hypothetical protein